MEDKSNIYGAKIIGYNCDNNGVTNWRIFYANENNIFIISENFITEDDCPKTKNYLSVYNNIGNSNYEKYELSMFNVINDYNGSEDIKDDRLKKLNNGYFEYLEKNNKVSTSDNMKAVAYMMDIDIWKGYAGDNAEYAIGGPTLEMFFNSYNEKYKTNYEIKEIGNDGYKITNYKVGEFGTDELYTPVDQYERGSTILASPLDYGTQSLGYWMPCLWFTGSLTENAIVDHYGLRPVVCLKSDVKLELKEDGSFEIK